MDSGPSQAPTEEAPMGSYEDTVRILEWSSQVEQAFRGLTDEQWGTATRLRPLDESRPRWTLFELAGHFDHAYTMVGGKTPAQMPDVLAGRPPGLTDDLAWVRSASGRGPGHPDPRRPLIG
jgi:hypothetical protein